MLRYLGGVALAAGVLLPAAPTRAGSRPLVRPAGPPALGLPGDFYPPPVYLRRNPYEVWQYYDVDRRGFFRPRVFYSSYSSFYLYNGQPYLFAPMRPLDFMPYLVD
jgi:hypothetical protein